MPLERRARLLIGLTLLLAAIAPAGAPAAARPVAVAVDTESEGPSTRLTVTLSQAVEPRVFVMERPDRVVIELPEVNFQLAKEAGQGREGLISSFRYGLFAPGRSRLVIDLAQPALVSRTQTATRASDGAAVLTVELTRTDREAFRRAAKADEAAHAPVQPAPTRRAAPGDRRPLIVIDPGHGGVDPGAIPAAAVFEKDIVFAFAQRLRRRLDASGRYRTLMTRDEDVFVALEERVRIAQAARADLMISIHADSISAAPHIRGMTVYTGAERATDPESARLAERENRADAAGGIEPASRPAEVADILQDLTQRETRGFSHRFAKRLLAQLEPVMPQSKKPHREAGFLVLRAPDIPSVLVELGYLSSRKDIGLLLSNEWRDRSAAAMASAIDLYFATRVAGDAGAAAVSP
ncbi:MAG: N-acetylmuramoyl-L-alanine amidase [uncultured Microvirga sp.]|uniref:N-acetylmuramoyl-L-alanine amidase n=1 Tax=uncultured Microvirga sp. TaxID=412392 RepID=A0A6J4MHI6_9HYPH|nr:MAG: N-acetylmuramoyl-L-alanine amidase [uncultured Microvirga sp.]